MTRTARRPNWLHRLMERPGPRRVKVVRVYWQRGTQAAALLTPARGKKRVNGARVLLQWTGSRWAFVHTLSLQACEGP